jgi:hypothetical protein
MEIRERGSSTCSVRRTEWSSDGIVTWIRSLIPWTCHRRWSPRCDSHRPHDSCLCEMDNHGGWKDPARGWTWGTILLSHRTHLPATWSSGHHRGGRRSSWVLHAAIPLPRHRNRGKPRITVQIHCADVRQVWWTPVIHRDAIIILTPSKFRATAVGPYIWMPPPVPLVCYEPRALPLASD